MCIDDSDQVIIITGVIVCTKIDPIVDKAEINTDIEFMLFFISQFAVFQIFYLQARFFYIGERAVRGVVAVYHTGVGNKGGASVGSQTIRSL